MLHEKYFEAFFVFVCVLFLFLEERIEAEGGKAESGDCLGIKKNNGAVYYREKLGKRWIIHNG